MSKKNTQLQEAINAGQQDCATPRTQLQAVPDIPKQAPILPSEDLTLSVASALEAKNARPQLRIVKALPKQLEELIENGIPVRKAVFHRTVLFDYAGGTPESAFFSPEWAQDVKKQRVAKMWYTPHGLVCEQNGMWKIVPLANVSDTTL